MPSSKSRKVLSLLAGILLLAVILLWANSYPDLTVDQLKTNYATSPSKFVKIGELDVHYRDEGQGEPIVLLHGTGASLHTWDGWVEEMKDSFRVIRFDMPAFGLTGPVKSGKYSIESYIEFINDFVEKIGLNTFHLAGNSLGGNIAWNYAGQHPEKIRKLILVAPSGLPIPNWEKPMAIKLASTSGLSWLVRYVSPKWMVRKSLREVYADDSKVTEELVDRYHDLLRREGNRQAFIDRVNQIKTDDSSRLANIKAPVLIQWGKQDLWLPISLMPRFKAQLPAAETITYDDLGHVPMEEAPVKTVKDAIKFLESPILKPIEAEPVLMKR